MPRTVTDRPQTEPNAEMSAVGYVLAAGALLLLLPILPFLVVLWLYDRLVGSRAASR